MQEGENNIYAGSRMIIKHLAVILIAMINDIIWVLYIRKSSQGKAFQAAAWGAVLYAAGMVVVMGILSDHRFLISATAGSFAGTYWAVKLSKKLDEKEK
jgi:Na+/H+ antiporter NhaD/arsenite permease-like protein